jgi:hypothetical protein
MPFLNGRNRKYLLVAVGTSTLPAAVLLHSYPNGRMAAIESLALSLRSTSNKVNPRHLSRKIWQNFIVFSLALIGSCGKE